MKINKNLSLFLLCHLLVWSVLPILMRPNLPMDSAEALVWGFIGEWGTNKHPPVSGFFANLIYQLTSSPASLYVLSQLFVVTGLAYVYKLARLFLPEQKALIAALILEGVAYYSLVTPEYNVNIIALLLWPAAAYHFYCGVKHNRLTDWLLFGVFAGLNVLTKYVSGILLLCLAAYLVLTKPGRACFRSWKLYVAAAVALAVVAPHIIWLWQHDWFVLDYFLARSGGGKSYPFGLAHLIYPLKFIGAQILTSAFAWLVLLAARRYSPKEAVAVSAADRTFIFFAGILPVLVMAAISLVFGIKLKSMWGSPVLYMLGIAFFVWLPFDIRKTFRPLLKACYAALVLFAAAFLLQCLLTDSAKFRLDAADFTARVGGENYAYVGGSVWLASTVGVYAANHPAVLFLMSPASNPWIDMADVAAKGILVVEENPVAYQNYQKTFANLPEPEVYLLKATNILGQSREYKLYYGTITGEKK